MLYSQVYKIYLIDFIVWPLAIGFFLFLILAPLIKLRSAVHSSTIKTRTKSKYKDIKADTVKPTGKK